VPGLTTRFADLMVFSPGADQQTGLTASEIQFPLPGSLLSQTIDSGLMEIIASRVKTLCIVVTTAVTFAAANNVTVQLFAARTKYGVLGGDTATTTGGPIGWAAPTTPYLGSGAAGSSFPTGNVPNACQLVGVPATWQTGVTNIAAGIYWFSPGSPGSSTANPVTSLLELQYWYPVLGVEIKSSVAAPTAGVYQVFLEVAPL